MVGSFFVPLISRGGLSQTAVDLNSRRRVRGVSSASSASSSDTSEAAAVPVVAAAGLTGHVSLAMQSDEVCSELSSMSSKERSKPLPRRAPALTKFRLARAATEVSSSSFLFQTLLVSGVAGG